MRGRVIGLLVVIAALLAGVVVAGCGGGGDTTGATEAATSGEETAGGGGGSEDSGGTFSYLATAGSSQFLKGLNESFMPAFEEESGLKTAVDNFCCGTEKLKQQQDADDVTWSATNWATTAEFLEAKENGQLEKLDPAVVDTSKLQPGTYDEYGYGVWKTATVVAWLPGAFPAGQEPTKFEDLFDTEKFPGKRCLYKYQEFGGTLEGALLSEGVAPDELYPLDLDKAFNKLDEMSDDIVWWTTGAQAAQFLLNGQCKMAAMWNGVAQDTAAQGNEIEIAWPQSIIFLGYNSVPKESPNPEAAQKFLGMIIDNTEAQEKFYETTAYTVPLKNPSIPKSVQKWAPEGQNVAESITEDGQYYFEHSEEIAKEFEDFLITSG
jgi:putative spermidine/putrescine transport system substrate-binding protein